MKTVEQWADDCPEPCDIDCALGPIHCPNLHLAAHKHHTHSGDPMPDLNAAKAYAALIGSIVTALLGVFTADTTVGKILTVVAVVLTAFVTYQVPNQPKV